MKKLLETLTIIAVISGGTFSCAMEMHNPELAEASSGSGAERTTGESDYHRAHKAELDRIHTVATTLRTALAMGRAEDQKVDAERFQQHKENLQKLGDVIRVITREIAGCSLSSAECPDAACSNSGHTKSAVMQKAIEKITARVAVLEKRLDLACKKLDVKRAVTECVDIECSETEHTHGALMRTMIKEAVDRITVLEQKKPGKLHEQGLAIKAIFGLNLLSSLVIMGAYKFCQWHFFTDEEASLNCGL